MPQRLGVGLVDRARVWPTVQSLGSETWPQVAGSVLGWLEERRHVMVTALAGAAAR